MNRQAQGVVLLLLGGAVLKASLTDMYLRYVKAGLQPFLIAAGVVLVAAAVMTLIHDLRGRADTHDGHDHGTGGPKVGWLLILPVLGLLLVAPPALGSYAAGQSGTALTSQSISDYPPLPPGDPAQISLLEYASRAVFDNGASLDGRSVQMTGFVIKGEGTELILARIILSCCAADGRPIKIGMTGDAPHDLAADTWVEVTGRYSTQHGTDPVNGEQIPYLDVESWTRIDPPKNQYQ